MNAIISRGDKTAHVQLPVGRKQLSGALSYLGANHTSDYDLRYNEENKDGLKVSLECFGVVENAIAKALPVGFRFHTLNESLTLMGNLPYQNRREVENTIKVDGLDSYEQLNRMLTEAYPQSVTTKYYCPLTIQVHSRDCYGDIDEDGYEEDAEFAARHEDLIRQKMLEYNASDEVNMAEYFHGNHGVSEKLRFADWDFERRNGELYGCITVLEIERTKVRPAQDIDNRLNALFEKIDEASSNIEEFNNQIIRQLIAQIRVDSEDKMTIILASGYRFEAKLTIKEVEVA